MTRKLVLALAVLLAVACSRGGNENANKVTSGPATTSAVPPTTANGTGGTSSTAPIAATGTEVVHGASGAETSTIVTPTTTTASVSTPTETTSTVVTETVKQPKKKGM